MNKIPCVVLLLFISLFCNISFSQETATPDYSGILSELYLYRQPSAKAEAMGRAMVANTNGDFGSYYNPALTSLSSGLILNASYSSPYYLADKSSFNYFGIGYTDKKIGSFSLSRYHWTLGEKIIITNETGAEIGESEGDLTSSLYTLNYSREIIRDFYAGVNLGIANMNFPETGNEPSSSGNAFTLDLGLLKKFEILSPSNKNLLLIINKCMSSCLLIS